MAARKNPANDAAEFRERQARMAAHLRAREAAKPAVERLRAAYASAARECADAAIAHEVAVRIYWRTRTGDAWCEVNRTGDAHERATNALDLARLALADEMVGAL